MRATVFPVKGSARHVDRLRRVARAALRGSPAKIAIVGSDKCPYWTVRLTGSTHDGAARLVMALAEALGEHADEAFA